MRKPLSHFLSLAVTLTRNVANSSSNHQNSADIPCSSLVSLLELVSGLDFFLRRETLDSPYC